MDGPYEIKLPGQELHSWQFLQEAWIMNVEDVVELHNNKLRIQMGVEMYNTKMNGIDQ